MIQHISLLFPYNLYQCVPPCMKILCKTFSIIARMTVLVCIRALIFSMIRALVCISVCWTVVGARLMRPGASMTLPGYIAGAWSTLWWQGTPVGCNIIINHHAHHQPIPNSCKVKGPASCVWQRSSRTLINLNSIRGTRESILTTLSWKLEC
jgi:hypothetical protein